MQDDDEEEEEKKIQIVAFSTNIISQSPIDITKIFLENYNHRILKKTKRTISFSLQFPYPYIASKVMISSVLDLEKEYGDITRVNSYIIYIDLQREDSKEKAQNILNYFQLNCDSSKKVFLIGVKSSENEKPNVIRENDLIDAIKKISKNFDYQQLDIDNDREVSDFLIKVLKYCYDNPNVIYEEDKNSCGSCFVI